MNIPTAGDVIPQNETLPERLPLSAIEQNIAAKVEELNQLLGHNLVRTHYNMGRALGEVFEDMASGGSRYGKSAMERISDELGISSGVLYKCQEVASTFTEDEIQKLTNNPGIKWSHVREAVRVTDPEKRRLLVEQLLEAPKAPTAIEFKRQVDEVRGTQEPPAVTSSKGNSGGGSRTGTGRGGSPLTAIKRSGKLSDQLAEQLKGALESLGGFDPESERVAENLTDALEQALGCVCDVVATCAGFLERAEEHMAAYPTKIRQTSQAARAAVYSQAVTSLSGLSAAIDAGTLAPADPNKDEAPLPVKKEAAKAAKPPKATASRAPVDPDVPVPPKTEPPKTRPTPKPQPATPPVPPSVDKEQAKAALLAKARAAREKAQASVAEAAAAEAEAASADA